jgi:hypothetical protein
MRPIIAKAGTCCAACGLVAWGGEAFVAGRFGFHCAPCWFGPFDSGEWP